MSLSEFFDSGDGLTLSASISSLSWSGEGMLDLDQTDFNLDNSGPSQERYEFVTQVFDSWRSAVGETLLIGSDSYTVTAAEPDATGLLTLRLFME